MFEQHNSTYNYEKKVVHHLKEQWNSKIRNEKEFSLYKGKKFEKEEVNHPDFLKTFLYVGELFQATEWDNRTKGLKQFDERIGKELVKWEANGEMCLHLSVLTYLLLEKYGVFTDKEMKLIQGYFLHKARKDNPFASAIANIHVGIHAWLSIKGKIIDLSIGQERDFFDFKGMDVIIGEVPEGMTFKGFQEPRKVVQKHAKRYSKFLNMTDEEWIEMHVQEANQFFNKASAKA
jgi:hypothetical protein